MDDLTKTIATTVSSAIAERLVDHYIPTGRGIYVEVRKDG